MNTAQMIGYFLGFFALWILTFILLRKMMSIDYAIPTAFFSFLILIFWPIVLPIALIIFGMIKFFYFLDNILK